MAIVAALALTEQASAVRLTRQVEEPETDLYQPVYLNGFQKERFEKLTEFVHANPETVFGDGKTGLFNSRASSVEGANEGDPEPK